MSDPGNRNLSWHGASQTRSEREARLGQKGCVLWLTGLSGSGKSTIARELEKRLVESGVWAYVLDGDNLRHGLNADLAFSAGDRDENIRRAGETAALFADAGMITIAAFISPYRAGRARAQAAADRLLGEGRWFDVHLAIDVDACRARDPKGLYEKADAGEIADFTGVSAPYEAPEAPALALRTGEEPVETCVAQVLKFLEDRGLIDPMRTP